MRVFSVFFLVGDSAVQVAGARLGRPGGARLVRPSSFNEIWLGRLLDPEDINYVLVLGWAVPSVRQVSIE